MTLHYYYLLVQQVTSPVSILEILSCRYFSHFNPTFATGGRHARNTTWPAKQTRRKRDGLIWEIIRPGRKPSQARIRSSGLFNSPLCDMIGIQLHMPRQGLGVDRIKSSQELNSLLSKFSELNNFLTTVVFHINITPTFLIFFYLVHSAASSVIITVYHPAKCACAISSSSPLSPYSFLILHIKRPEIPSSWIYKQKSWLQIDRSKACP